MSNKRLPYGSGAIMNTHARYFQTRLAHPELARPGNVFDCFCNARNEKGDKFSLPDAESECFLFTVASQDTTAAFITPLIALIASHPEVYEKVMAELRAFETNGQLSHPVI